MILLAVEVADEAADRGEVRGDGMAARHALGDPGDAGGHPRIFVARRPVTDMASDSDSDSDFHRDLDFPLLCALTETGGVPGYEDRVRDLVREQLAEHTDVVRTDAMGNVVGTVEGEGDYEVVVAAHMDEIGFMVRHVDAEGFLVAFILIAIVLDVAIDAALFLAKRESDESLVAALQNVDETDDVSAPEGGRPARADGGEEGGDH